ncbi:MAG: galactitol-1-phosphate 5-dehydrogenase [Candidatus Acidiferrales bacterium]|jgi:L-iditol 2-dehydrogenase
MKALLLSQYRQLEIADLPVPDAGPGEVLLRVAACGICGSDVHGYDGASGRRIPPLVMGHEASGTVAALGAGVKNFAVGDRVTFDSTVSCGECAYCVRGEINLCDRRQVLGVSCGDYRRAGAFAEYVTVPARIVYRMPDALSFEEAAMMEPVSVAVHAVSLTPLAPKSSALVIGAGTIGLLILQVLRASGCDRVFVADIDATRLRRAEKAGATETVLASKLSLGDDLIRLFAGAAAVDVAVEAVGLNETVNAAIQSVRKGGAVTLVGNISPEVTLPLQKVVAGQIRLQGSCASAGEYPRAMELVASGAVDVKSLISAVAPLEDGPAWFERLYAHEANLLKVVLAPGKSS